MEPDWYDLKGYEGLYEINKKGQIILFNKRIPIRKNKNGYWVYTLTKDGISKEAPVHRLLALQFIPKPPDKQHVKHINGDRSDFSLENLEWSSRLKNFGSDNKNAKAVNQLSLSGQFLKSFTSISAASRRTGIHKKGIVECCKKRLKTSGGFKWEYKTK